MKILKPLLAAAVLSAAFSSPALAQNSEGGAQTWSGSVTFKTPNERAVALAVAIEAEKARNGGITSDTYIEGDYNAYSTYNGPVVSSSSTNAVNSTSNTTTIGAGANASVTNNTESNSGTATQDANAQTAVGRADQGNSIVLSGFGG